MSRATVRRLAVLLVAVVAACDPVVVGPTPSGVVGPSISPTLPASSGTPSPSGSPTEPTGRAVTWSKVTPSGELPAARFGHSWDADPASAQAWLFGGDDGVAALGDLWLYDLSSDTWERVAASGAAPPARSRHAAAWVDGLGVIVVGGRGTDGAPMADAWRFDPQGLSWSALPAAGAAPPARSGGCLAVAPDGRLWLTHGRGANDALLGDTWVYDPLNGAWTDATPAGEAAPARDGHACWWTDDGQVAIYGGTTAAGVTADLWTLAAPGTTDAGWTAIEDLESSARTGGAVARNLDRFVVVGGLGADGTPLADVATFDAITLAAETFISSPDGPTPRSGAAVVDDPASERMLMFGGLAGAAPSGELWQLEVP